MKNITAVKLNLNNIIRIIKIKANGMRVRSKCEWNRHGEKFSKFFLNLEK